MAVAQTTMMGRFDLERVEWNDPGEPEILIRPVWHHSISGWPPGGVIHRMVCVVSAKQNWPENPIKILTVFRAQELCQADATPAGKRLISLKSSEVFS